MFYKDFTHRPRASRSNLHSLIHGGPMRKLTICTLSLLLGASSSLFASEFFQTNLVSDISGMASVTDPNLKDPWGMSFSSTSPIWVSDRATGVSTLYNGLTGAPVPLVVAVPPGAPLGPTGQVFA